MDSILIVTATAFQVINYEIAIDAFLRSQYLIDDVRVYFTDLEPGINECSYANPEFTNGYKGFNNDCIRMTNLSDLHKDNILCVLNACGDKKEDFEELYNSLNLNAPVFDFIPKSGKNIDIVEAFKTQVLTIEKANSIFNGKNKRQNNRMREIIKTSIEGTFNHDAAYDQPYMLGFQNIDHYLQIRFGTTLKELEDLGINDLDLDPSILDYYENKEFEDDMDR